MASRGPIDLCAKWQIFWIIELTPEEGLREVDLAQ